MPVAHALRAAAFGSWRRASPASIACDLVEDPGHVAQDCARVRAVTGTATGPGVFHPNLKVIFQEAPGLPPNQSLRTFSHCALACAWPHLTGGPFPVASQPGTSGA